MKIKMDRWFTWTVAFLLFSGIALTSYIVYSDDGLGDQNSWVIH